MNRDHVSLAVEGQLFEVAFSAQNPYTAMMHLYCLLFLTVFWLAGSYCAAAPTVTVTVPGPGTGLHPDIC